MPNRADIITAALDKLKSRAVVTYFRVENDGARVVVSVDAGYQCDDPNHGYDDDTQARLDAANATMGALGLRFHDAGCEDGGEYWIFVARA